MSRIVYSDGMQFCPDCGSRLDRKEQPLIDPTFDDQRHEIRIGNVRRHLSPVRYRLLFLLRCRFPLLTPHSTLEGEIFSEYEDARHALRVHIWDLNKFFLKDTPYKIQNEYGYGYRLVRVDEESIAA